MLVELRPGGQFAVPEQIDHFLEGGVLCQVRDVIAEVAQLSFGAIDIADSGCGCDHVAQAGGLGCHVSPSSSRAFVGPSVVPALGNLECATARSGARYVTDSVWNSTESRSTAH